MPSTTRDVLKNFPAERASHDFHATGYWSLETDVITRDGLKEQHLIPFVANIDEHFILTYYYYIYIQASHQDIVV